MSWKSPFVSRFAFELAIAAKEAAEVREKAARADAHAMMDEARRTMAEARAIARDAINMSKVASESMFGSVAATDKPLPTASSVRINDRMAAIRIREADDRG